MISNKKEATKPVEGTALFDEDTFIDAQVERMVDTQGISYADARRRLGIESPSYEPEIAPSEVVQGAAVELGARALALSNIMDTYNQLNKNMGASKVRQYANNRFDMSYDRPDEVREDMGKKASAMLHAIKADFNTLSGGADLRAQGFETDEVDRIEEGVKSDLLNKYGPGKAYAPDRAKVVRKAKTAAKKGNKNNKR